MLAFVSLQVAKATRSQDYTARSQDNTAGLWSAKGYPQARPDATRTASAEKDTTDG